MTTSAKKIAELDRWFPPRGKCEMCGHKDARHRVWDKIVLCDWFTNEETAHEYGLPMEAIEAVRRIRPYRR